MKKNPKKDTGRVIDLTERRMTITAVSIMLLIIVICCIGIPHFLSSKSEVSDFEKTIQENRTKLDEFIQHGEYALPLYEEVRVFSEKDKDGCPVRATYVDGDGFIHDLSIIETYFIHVDDSIANEILYSYTVPSKLHRYGVHLEFKGDSVWYIAGEKRFLLPHRISELEASEELYQELSLEMVSR